MIKGAVSWHLAVAPAQNNSVNKWSHDKRSWRHWIGQMKSEIRFFTGWKYKRLCFSSTVFKTGYKINDNLSKLWSSHFDILGYTEVLSDRNILRSIKQIRKNPLYVNWKITSVWYLQFQQRDEHLLINSYTNKTKRMKEIVPENQTEIKKPYLASAPISYR